MSIIRIEREYDLINKECPYGCTVGIFDNDKSHWIATIIGPENTPYYGGIFKLDILFPTDYPYKAPKINFKTKIYHPNISSSSGSICIDILKDKWSPALNITQVLLSICSLLDDPNPDDPLVPEIAKLFQSNKAKYEANAREATMRFAMI